MSIKYGFLSILLSIIGLLSSYAAAATCSRDDIDHYLKNGFTPEQITQLCANQKQTVDTEEQKEVNQQDKDALFLDLAIRAKELRFLDEQFYYIARECIYIGQLPEKLEPTGKKYCGLVRTTIDYQNLVVLDRSLLDLKLFRKPSVPVKGRIQRETVDDEKINYLTKHEYKLLQQKLDSPEQVDIPIQNNVSLDRVKAELNKLAK